MNFNHKNSVILCHELIVLKKPPLVRSKTLSIAIVKVLNIQSFTLVSNCTMSRRGTGAKRARQEPSSYISTSSNHSTTRSSQSATSKPGTSKQPPPHINPKVFRQEDVAWLRDEKGEAKYKDKLCSMCTSDRKRVHHHHFSTSNIRTFALCWTEGDFMCPICHKPEPPLQSKEITKRVILSSSTLYGIWDQPSLPTIAEHLELECIVGARVRDLTRALEKNLLYLSNRLEIVVIAGINNVGEGQHPDLIVEEMRHMKEVVKQHSKENGHNPPSYVSFATLLLPPKFCSFKVPEGVPDLAEWIPGPNFVDRYRVIEQVNKKVKEMNQEDGLSWINLHLHGVKKFKSGMLQHKFDTRPGSKQIWRERQVFKKLHFTMENKLKLVGYIENCFKSNSKG